MFLSWKPSGRGSQGPDTNRLIAFDPVTAKTQTSQACSNCRSRKLKCVWDGGGCERCRASGRKCIYESTSAKAGTHARQRSKHGGSGTRPSTSRWTEAEQATNPSSPPSPLGTTHQSDQTVTTRPKQPAVVTTPADKGLAQCESCCISSSVFSVDAPSTTLESMFIGGDMDIITSLDMEMDVDGGTASNQWREPASDVPAGLKAGEDDVTLAVTGSYTCKLTTTPAVTPGHAPEMNHGAQTPESSGLCGCLPQVVHLVEEIDALVERDGLRSLDGALAAHKEALGCGATMLRCRVCTGRLENMIMLALMVDKLVRMCKGVSEACCAGLGKVGRMGGAADTHATASNDMQPSSGEMPLLTLQRHHDGDNQQPWGRCGTTTTTASSTNTRVYNVDSSAEYFFVVAGILRFQLLQLFNLTQQLRGVTAPLASDRISQRITAVSEAVLAMMCKAGLTTCGALGLQDQDADALVLSWPGPYGLFE